MHAATGSRRYARSVSSAGTTLTQEVRERLMALEPAALDETEADAVYDGLRARLQSVPKDKRFRTWRQTSVLLDVRFRRRPAGTLRRLQQLRTSMTRNGRAHEFERFHATVRRLLGDLTLTPHGYAPSLSTTDEKVLWGRVAALGERLEDAGLSWFVTSGTLLGLVRHAGVIPHDDDVDLCVLLDAADEGEAARAWLRARAALADLLRPQRLHRVAKVDVHDGPTIDLFPAWIAGARLFAWPWSYGDVAADHVLPLETRVVAGAGLRLPSHPEQLLTVNYGEDWRIPDPLFTFDWTGARSRFATFVHDVEQP